MRNSSRYALLGNCIGISPMPKCGIACQMTKQNFSSRLELTADHPQPNQKAAERVLFIVAGVMLVVDPILVLAKSQSMEMKVQ